MGILLIRSKARLLGIHLDQDLNFDIQTEVLCKSLSKQKSPFLKRSHKMLYYDAVLKPSFLYGSGVWSSTSKANLDSILRLQKRAARVILNAPANSRSLDLFNTLNWVPFYSESHINQGALIYKRLKGNTPNYLKELLILNFSMHTRNTRYCNLNLFCP